VVKATGKSMDGMLFNSMEKSNTSESSSDEQSQTNGSFDFTYKLNSNDNSIFAIYGEIGIKLPAYDKKVTFECYEQT